MARISGLFLEAVFLWCSSGYRPDPVSGRSKPARDGRMKTSHFELVHRAGLRLPPHPTQHPPQSGWFLSTIDRSRAGGCPAATPVLDRLLEVAEVVRMQGRSDRLRHAAMIVGARGQDGEPDVARGWRFSALPWRSGRLLVDAAVRYRPPSATGYSDYPVPLVEFRSRLLTSFASLRSSLGT